MDARSLLILEYDKIIHELTLLTHTSPGRDLCEALQPVSILNQAISRQTETDDAVKLILEKGVLPLSGISDIRNSVARARSDAQLSCGELMRIGAFLRAMARLKAQLPHDADLSRIIYQLLTQLRLARELETRLDEAIAGEDELHDRASVQLASIRRRIRDTQNEVKESLARIVRSHAKALQDQLVTLRGDRYVVPVKADCRGEIPGIVHDISSSGATLFVEPLAVVELNNKIRELIGLEREEIDRILQELSGKVGEQAELLLNDAEIAAELDFLMAKGRLAIKMDAMPPVMNDRGRIRLRAARHPLIPKERVVPIDFELGTTFKTLVITGPNTGGKTVSLKTCGLFCLMAMAGLQIPVRDGSEISVFDEVLADIGDEQSIEQDLSTFSSHMRNIINITDQARPRTLVLVDELGSGTDPSEGAALAISILDHLRKHGCLTVATTHYKELKGYALNTPDVENACCEFNTETLRPTYRLLIGVPGVSNAFAISRRLGLQDGIIQQARALISEEGIRFEELIQTVEKSRSETDRLHQEAIDLRDQAAAITRQLAEEKAQLADKSRQVVQKAREEARELYSDALQEIERMLDQIRDQQKAQDFAESHQLATQTRQKIRSGLNRVEGEIGKATLSASGESLAPEDIQIGSSYFAPALSLLGKIIDGPDNKGYYTLQSGTMHVNVTVDALRMPETAEQSKKATDKSREPRTASRRNSIVMDRKLNMTSEIQLLGQTVDEAISNLDQYIDNAVLAGIDKIRIVHGKGTGALRAAVHQHLKRDKRIKEFRIGAYGEGDSGVTFAELK